MLSSLDTLAGKITPGNGVKGTPNNAAPPSDQALLAQQQAQQQQHQHQQHQQQTQQHQQQLMEVQHQQHTHQQQQPETYAEKEPPAEHLPTTPLPVNNNHTHQQQLHQQLQQQQLTPEQRLQQAHQQLQQHQQQLQHQHQQQQQQLQLRFNELDNNCNKLTLVPSTHINHNNAVVTSTQQQQHHHHHPYAKQQVSPPPAAGAPTLTSTTLAMTSATTTNARTLATTLAPQTTTTNSTTNASHANNNSNNNNNNNTTITTTAATTTSPLMPFSLPAYTTEQQDLLQAQHELFQKQLQLQQQQTQKLIASMQQQLQQHQQNHLQHQHKQRLLMEHHDDEYKLCLKDSAFGMSDKSSTTNSLPNSPIHTTANAAAVAAAAAANAAANNNGSLLSNANSNNAAVAAAAAAAVACAAAAAANNNNNNNTCSANRNVVVNVNDDDSCYRMDTDMSSFGEKEPDPDNIKMFVGQVPKSMDEAQLREMFEEYGPVHSINVLRDKATGISKGCCFVTFYTRRAALKAQDALHNVKTLNGMYHPIQMKPADSENRNERKLFVGMLNKKLNENDVRKLFEVHGAIEECTVLRDQNGQSKGCAFVTFATKHAAISAIKVTLNQNKIMEGCTSPLVVKFADTQKEKEQKKIQQIQANLWNLATNINIPLGQTATTVSTPILPNPPQQPSPVLGADALTPASLQLLQQLQAVGLQQQLLQGLGAQTANTETAAATAAAAAAAGLLPPMTVQNLAALAAMTQPALTSATNPGSAQLTNTAALLCLLGKTGNSGSDPNPLASAYMSTAAGLPQFGSAAALTASPLATVALSAAAAAAAGKQIEGPEGCNLFIYHLPQEFTDTDLASTFLPFGNVISAKVFIDKQTSLSKCFGFVSFDNPDSAQVAIKAMNGFQVGTKRLKVQLKKPKDASKPY